MNKDFADLRLEPLGKELQRSSDIIGEQFLKFRVLGRAIMFLSKHKNGYYYIYYTDLKGKRNKKSTHQKPKSEAHKYLSTFKEQLESEIKSKLNPSV